MNDQALKVFICHAREDEAMAKRFFDDLGKRGANPWLDTENLLPGQAFKEAIRAAIHESSHILLLTSRHSLNKTGFVQVEIAEAIQRNAEYPPGKIHLIQARLDATVPQLQKLQDLHWINVFTGYRKALNDISRAIGVYSDSQLVQEMAETMSYSLEITESASDYNADGFLEINDTEQNKVYRLAVALKIGSPVVRRRSKCYVHLNLQREEILAWRASTIPVVVLWVSYDGSTRRVHWADASSASLRSRTVRIRTKSRFGRGAEPHLL